MLDDGYFDEAVAAGYDDPGWDMFHPEKIDPVVDFLIARVGSGRALELGIGTGRIALPLAQRGIPVAGIDISRAMVARLAAKPGGENIEVTIGDFAHTRVSGEFSLVYLVFNTIMNLTSQQAQVDCFRNAASHRESGGCFVIEVAIPDLQRIPVGETTVVFRSDDTGWGLDEYDIATQSQTSHHLERVDDRIERFSIPFRYVWPSELDLMAELAGMSLRERYGSWDGDPFTSYSRQHISVWEKG